MNNLYEFGGSCDVIVRCKGERIIGGKHYKAGEPYTILKDVIVNIGYRTTIAEQDSTSNIYAHRTGMPDIVSLSRVTLNTKVCDLIAERIEPQTIMKFYETTADEGLIYLPEKFVPNSTYVYANNTSVENYQEETDKLTGDFVEGQNYLIFYSVYVDNIYYDFNVPSYGYFSLEIIGKGNLNDKTQNVHLTFPAVSLISVPVFDFVNGSILHAPLQFQCIHKMQKQPYFVVGD